MSSNAASTETLSTIHNKVADAYLKLLAAVEHGGVCEACGVVNEKFATVNPAVLGHINKFLDANNIQAIPVVGGKVDRLKAKGKLVILPKREEYESFAAGE